MRIDNLKSPGQIVNGLALRREACKAVSYSELYMTPEARRELAEFFLDCAKKCAPPKPNKEAA